MDPEFLAYLAPEDEDEEVSVSPHKTLPFLFFILLLSHFLCISFAHDAARQVNHRFRGRHEVGWRPGESDYANRKNYTSCAEYLSSTLATYGWPQPVALDKSTNDMVTITNALYQALTAYQVRTRCERSFLSTLPTQGHAHRPALFSGAAKGRA
jgi:hypothetical protein